METFINMDVEKIEDKMSGCLYGQAIGDALGLGSEFMSKDDVINNYPKGLEKYDQIIQDSHRLRWIKGAWTDDTDMMLCILDSFENNGFNIKRIAYNFKDWFNGDPMGIGSHTYKILCMRDYVEQPEMCSELWWELSHRQSAANGALMRTSVVGLAHDNVEKQAVDICKLTHFDPRCIGTCVIASLIINNLVWNNYELTYEEIEKIAKRYDERIIEWVDCAYKNEDISALDLDEPYSIGYTLRTLSAALWCYWHAKSFTEGLLAVVNEGGDADTNAAVAGSILGAKFGYNAIPKHYIDELFNKNEYRTKCEKFIHLAVASH